MMAEPVGAAPALQFHSTSTLQPPGTVFLLDGNASAARAGVDHFPSQALTLSLWVKTTATDRTQTLLSYQVGADTSTRLWIRNPTDLAVGFGPASSGSTLCSVNDGFWHQLSVILTTVDDTHYGVGMYKDGLPVFQSTGLLSHPQDRMLHAGGQLILGQGITGEAGFVGQLSEFCLWESALRPEQILTRLLVRQSSEAPGALIIWSLLSASSVTAQGGTINGGSFVQAPDLSFRQIQAQATWSALSGATYDLAVTDGRGRNVFTQTGISVTSSIVPDLWLNTPYLAQVRAIVNGSAGPWGTPVRLIPLLLQQVELDYQNAEQQAIWGEVDQEEQYVVSLYANQSSTPTTIEPPQTTRTFPLADLLAGQQTWRIAVQALTAGSYGPANSSLPQPGQPVFTLAYNTSNAQNPILQVQWEALPGAARFYLTITRRGALAPALAVLLNPEQSPYLIPRTQVNFQDNELYDANVRALGVDSLGPWGITQTVMITTLAAPQLSFVSAGDRLNVTWGDIRSQVQKDAGLSVTYTLVLDQGTSPIDRKSNIANSQAERIYLVSSSQTNRLVVAESFTVRVQSLAPGLQSPWSQPPALTPPAATTFAYHWEQIASPLLVGWQEAGGPSQYTYYQIVRQGSSTPLSAALLPGNVTSTSTSAPVGEGSQLQLSARALGAGVITVAGTPASLTVHQIVAPVLYAPVADASAHTIAASWTFHDPIVSSPHYQVQLLQGSSVLESATLSSTSQTFTNAAIVAGATLSVQVQAFEAPNYGRLASVTLTVTATGALPQVQGLSCQSNPNGDLSLSWSPVGVSGVLYDAQILQSDRTTVRYTRTGLATSAASLARSESGVTLGETYYVRVRATQGAVQGDYSALSQVQAGSPSPTGGRPAHNGDPVNVATGAYAYNNVDLSVNGVLPLRFAVHYDTVTPLPTENPLFTGRPLGLRWNHAYNTRLAPDDGQVLLLWGSGQVDTYIVPASVTGVYAPAGVPSGDTLVFGSNLQYTLTRADQSVYTFDRTGALLLIASPAGNTQTLTYAGAQLRQIRDDQSGRFLTLEYSGAGLINRVSDHSGRFISYTYENGTLRTMQDVMRRTRTFSYAPGNLALIETIVDQNEITFLKNVYDELRRVVFQQDGRALQAHASYGVTLTYQPGPRAGTLLTTFTDQEGNVTEYTSLQANGNLLGQVVYLNAEKTRIRRTLLSYDGFNNVLTRTIYEGEASQADLLQGNTTTYTYDASNNLCTVTDPLQQTTTRLYTPGNQLLA
ncbi:MAG TPA: DUF6531 domain-containing protein, partial [Ktedonobacteraceae bacterium]